MGGETVLGTVRFPPLMTLLAFLLTALSVRGVAAEAAARPYRSSGNITPVYGQTSSREFTRGPADTVRPYLAFPETGLDDPAAYEGYETRVYRDASGNAFQVYLNRSKGRVVHLWADALNESAGFTARDSAGAPAALTWGSAAAVVGASGHTRSVSYSLEAPSSVALGLLRGPVHVSPRSGDALSAIGPAHVLLPAGGGYSLPDLTVKSGKGRPAL